MSIFCLSRKEILQTCYCYYYLCVCNRKEMCEWLQKFKKMATSAKAPSSSGVAPADQDQYGSVSSCCSYDIEYCQGPVGPHSVWLQGVLELSLSEKWIWLKSASMVRKPTCLLGSFTQVCLCICTGHHQKGKCRNRLTTEAPSECQR
jgi:hypothetical protein